MEQKKTESDYPELYKLIHFRKRGGKSALITCSILGFIHFIAGIIVALTNDWSAYIEKDIQVLFFCSFVYFILCLLCCIVYRPTKSKNGYITVMQCKVRSINHILIALHSEYRSKYVYRSIYTDIYTEEYIANKTRYNDNIKSFLTIMEKYGDKEENKRHLWVSFESIFVICYIVSIIDILFIWRLDIYNVRFILVLVALIAHIITLLLPVIVIAHLIILVRKYNFKVAKKFEKYFKELLQCNIQSPKSDRNTKLWSSEGGWDYACEVYCKQHNKNQNEFDEHDEEIIWKYLYNAVSYLLMWIIENDFYVTPNDMFDEDLTDFIDKIKNREIPPDELAKENEGDLFEEEISANVLNFIHNYIDSGSFENDYKEFIEHKLNRKLDINHAYGILFKWDDYDEFKHFIDSSYKNFSN